MPTVHGIEAREESEITVQDVSTAATVLKDPYNEHNFMVNNANSVVEYNEDIFTEAKKLYKVFPFGGGSGLCDHLLTLIYYAVFLGGIFMIVAGIFDWFTRQNHGIMIGVALFLTLYHFVGVIIIYINGHRFFDKIYFIKVVNVALQYINHFLLIEANTTRTITAISANETEAVCARLRQSGRASAKVMIYTPRYHYKQYTAPKVKFFVILFIHLGATIINISSYIKQGQQT